MLLFMVFIVGMSATLVERAFNRLRYLINSALAVPSTLTITTTGGVTPDLLTDSQRGPIKICANAFGSGLGILAAGAKTQAQARAIWLANNADTVLGNSKVPRCRCMLTPLDQFGQQWQVDANVDASGQPFVIITNNSNTGNAYLDVFSAGAIGL